MGAHDSDQQGKEQAVFSDHYYAAQGIHKVVDPVTGAITFEDIPEDQLPQDVQNNLKVSRLVKDYMSRSPELQRVGDCRRFCGTCCRLSSFKDNPHVVALFPGVGPDGDSCQHLSWVNGMATCGIYETRPELCRVFPPVPVAIATIPQCGYRFITIDKRARASVSSEEQRGGSSAPASSVAGVPSQPPDTDLSGRAQPAWPRPRSS